MAVGISSIRGLFSLLNFRRINHLLTFINTCRQFTTYMLGLGTSSAKCKSYLSFDIKNIKHKSLSAFIGVVIYMSGHGRLHDNGELADLTFSSRHSQFV